MSWCPACSPCCQWASKKQKTSDKYSYVRYTPSSTSSKSAKHSPPRASTQVGIPDIDVPTPEQVFEFPQQPADLRQHPQLFATAKGPGVQHPKMFVDEPVMDQPKTHPHTKRFLSLPAGSVSVYPGGALLSSDIVSSRASTLPRRKKEKKERKRGGSLPGAQSGSLPDIRQGMSPPMLLHSGGGGGRRKSGGPKQHSSLLTRRGTVPYEGDIHGAMPTAQQEMGACWVPELPVLEEHSLDEDASHPLLQFSLMYDVQRCALTVHLHHGANLPAKDRRGTSDPFVVLYLVPNKEEIFESKVIQQTLDPVFDQSFEFKKLTPDDIFRQTLILRVYDHDKFSKNDSIGGVILPLKNTELFGVIMRMRIDEDPNLFSQDTRGDLLLALSYDTALACIKGVVLKATNLKRQDVIGQADPYIKIRLLHGKKIEDKWKSSVKRNTLVPVFNESFQFDVSGKDPSELAMEVLVMDYDRFSKDDLVGIIQLGSDVEGELERRHWTDMLNASPQVISQWHTIRPV